MRTKSARTPPGPDSAKVEKLQREFQKISLKQVRDEPTEVTFSKVLLQPYINSIGTIKQYQPLTGQADLTTMAEEMKAQSERVQSGDFSEVEAMLTAQAKTLDAIFHSLAQRAAQNIGYYPDSVATYLQLALKAQSQSRTTAEALFEMKFPKSATFIRQANIAGQQQVNNGQPPAHPCAQEKNSPLGNELLEAHHGERLDITTASKAGGINPDMEAVGTVYRAQD